jgi:outer membrane protein assembly factor BamE (lipoprotein component of BamABCDE complex)
MKSCRMGKLREGGCNRVTAATLPEKHLSQGKGLCPGTLTVLLLSLVLTGCGSLGAVGTIGTLGAIGTVGAYEALGTRTGTAAANNDTAIRKIKIGASRKPEVRRLLGDPSVAYANLLIDGRTVDVWAYRYSYHRQDMLTLVPILNFYSTQGISDESSVNVFFDVDGVVSDVRISRYK